MPNISGVEVRVFSSAPIMNIASEIDKLNLSPDQYVVIGSGILNQLGIRKTDDLDFIVNTEMFNKFKSKPGWVEKSWPQGEPTLQKGRYEIGTDWGDDTNIYSFEEVFNNSKVVSGVRFITLEFLRQWKAKKGRQKDLNDIILIDEYLKKHS